MSSFSRRTLLAATAAGLLLSTRSSSAATQLRILCWPAYDNAVATSAFRRDRDATIRANHIGANDEIFTFLRAGGLGVYDAVTPSNGLVQPLARAGLIQPLDMERLPNAAALLPAFQSPGWAMVDGQQYGLPLSWRTNPLVYNAESLATPPGLWTDLASERFRGKVVMIDDVIGHFTIWNRALGAADPARVTKTQLSDTAKLLTTIKRARALAYVGNFNDVATRLATGGGWASTTGQEIVPWLPQAGDANLQLARPGPGDFSVCDCLCIPTRAPNPELAYAYLDAMIAADAQAALANALYRATVSSAAIQLLSSDARGLFGYDDLDRVFAISPLFGFPPLEEEDELATYVDWVVAWDRIRFTPLQALNPPTPTPEPTVSPEATPGRGAYFE